MWELRNGTPFAADRTVVVDKTGERHWVVVIKGTFTVAAGGAIRVADEQLAPNLAPRYRGVDGESSLVYEQDLIAAKPRTDLYLNATAYAQGGRATRQLRVSLITPLGTKTLLITGTRRWERRILRGARASAPEPFVTMPVTYEGAFGGSDLRAADPSQHALDARNPVGRGFTARHTSPVGTLLPSIEHLDRDRRRGPAGFGALCSYWLPRVTFQGTYDERWAATQKPLLPLDYDPQFLQCAPRDQQFGPHLRGGERIELLNLTPDGRLALELPKHHFALTTHIGRRRLEHRARLNTVVIEPDVPRVVMTWHSTLSCHHDIDDIDVTRVVEKRYV